ncbi:hypothetical protein JIN77_16465 [Verrucomicrobiaceae bacterium R5-34]|nr:hypothetical protein [Verrucomicrobiaceae bacterium R5-34]
MKSLLALLALSTCLIAKEEKPYQPTAADSQIVTRLTSFSYNGREVPLKIYLPPTQQPAPLILLSHGLGGSREIGTYLGVRWASAGYVVVAMQHIGSDESIWKDTPALQRKRALKQAASFSTFVDRMKDVPATLDQLEKWNVSKGHVLEKRMDMEHIGIAGHSYGAVTTQALVGQHFGRLGPRYRDERIDAGFAMSPSVPRKGDAARAYGQVSVPMLLMTGTKDGNPMNNEPPESRRGVFVALPKSEPSVATKHYELVLKDAEHAAFSDHRTGKAANKNPNHHRVIQLISTAFWDSALKQDRQASAWLNGRQPKKLLEPGDLWQKK